MVIFKWGNVSRDLIHWIVFKLFPYLKLNFKTCCFTLKKGDTNALLIQLVNLILLAAPCGNVSKPEGVYETNYFSS